MPDKTCRHILPKAVATLAIIVSLPSIAGADEALPSWLTGTWVTGTTLYEGTQRQSELHFLADGVGLATGSTPASRHVGGADDGKPGPRAVIGFPVHAALDGDVLTVQPLQPGGPQAGKAYGPAMSCRYASAGPVLTCTGPDGTPMVLKRRSGAVPPEVVRAIDALQIRGR
jgi:hypothetical protein